MSKKLAIAMFGQKRLSREGGVEIVVKELCTRMAQNGCDVTCYNRAGHHVSGAEYDDAGKTEYEGIRQKSVPTIERRGLAAVSSSAFAALYSAFGKYDVVHIHAEGPAFFAWLPKMFGKRVVVTVHGHEWMRAKWSAPIRKYWKVSEQMMVKYCDLAICDSVNIEKYIHECYDGKGIKGRNPKTTFIAYGADLTLSKLADNNEKLVNWYKEKGLTKKDYYLVVGRFVPENSFEVMIREFMKSKSKKNFAIITNVNEKFLNELEEKLHFKSDKRIKFVGTVYDQELLKKIRENAYAYFHGHTVGGTNPSLIEALGSTDLNLLVDVGFNQEVAEDCALYWSRKPGSLAKLIDKADQMSVDEIAEMGRRAKKRVAEEYTWEKICGLYEEAFLR